MSKRKVAIFTGNRAEYGLQYPIIKAISQHPAFEYYLLASGAHLQEDFGRTIEEIEKDGFKVAREVKIDMGSDDLYGTAQAIGTGVLSVSAAIADIKPDLMVVYADRFEGFAAIIASTQMKVPTAHIEGGDITEGGALDDMVRHAMSKLAHMHFTTNEEAAERIRKMGEEAWRVFNVGFPAIDLIADGNFATEAEVIARLGVDPKKPIVLFTQHSVTTEFEDAVEQLKPALKAMEKLAKEGVQVIITYPNNDAGGKRIIDEIVRFQKQSEERKISNIIVRSSLGRYLYHGVLSVCGKYQGVCAGNSSSGIKETPAFACPNVNIGSRQQGRLRADNVIDTEYDEQQIYKACKKAIEDKDFRHISRTCENPYGHGGVGKKIAKILADIELDQKLIQKKMTY